MPIHDWSRVDANLYHDFHQSWTMSICNALNAVLLPKGFSALAERHGPTLVPDVMAMSDGRYAAQASMAAGANRVAIRHSLSRIICAIEIVSPGNKHSEIALRSFVEKSIEFLKSGVNLLIVDLFPPTVRDPQGIHKAIWDQIDDVPFELPANQPLTLAAYVAGQPTAYVEPIAVGEMMPDMPAYLDVDHYVPVPLEATYMQTWRSCPEDMREVVEKGELS